MVACALAVVMLGGCVSTKTTAVDDSSRLHGKTVALTSRPRAAFLASTAGKAAFGLLGVAAMQKAGSTLVTEDQLADPAVEVSQALLSAAEKAYGVVPAPVGPVSIDTTDVAALARAAKGADYLLDVQSYGQQFAYYPSDWSHYWVAININVRVIDVPGARLIAEGHCAPNSRDQPDPPNYDTLVGDHGARLKAMLDAQRDQCIAQFKKQVLRIEE
jgi:hypothetical protein